MAKQIPTFIELSLFEVRKAHDHFYKVPLPDNMPYVEALKEMIKDFGMEAIQAFAKTIPTVHRFTLAGLGEQPFKYIGMAEIPSPSLAEHNPQAYNAALAMLPPDIGVGTCAYCGTGLKYNFILENSAGRRFPVGRECIMKAGDSGLIKVAKKAKADLDRKKRDEKRKKDWEAKLQRERERNNGLTDAEVQMEKIEKRNAEIKKRREANVDHNMMATRGNDEFDSLRRVLIQKAQRSGFCASILSDLFDYNGYGAGTRFEDLPPKAIDIIEDIYGKHHARRGSKKYDRAVEYLWERIEG